MTTEEIRLQLTLALVEKTGSYVSSADAIHINAIVDKLYKNIVKLNDK